MALILEDNFNSSSIDTNKWSTPHGNWKPWSYTDLDRNNVSVSNGAARLKISKSSSGKPYRGCILENKNKTIQYGKCEVRAKLPPSNQGVVCYILLWPADGVWPPEIDFVETSGKDSSAVIFTQHWGKHQDNSHPQQESWLKNIDVTQWHIYSVEVTKDSIKWYVDGSLKTTQVNRSPNTRWNFSAGIWAGNCTGKWGGCPSGTFPKYMDIDYVKLWDVVPTETPSPSPTTTPTPGQIDWKAWLEEEMIPGIKNKYLLVFVILIFLLRR